MRLLVLDEAWQANGGVDTVRRHLLPSLAACTEGLWWAGPCRLYKSRIDGLQLASLNCVDVADTGRSTPLVRALMRRLPYVDAHFARAAWCHHLRDLCDRERISHVLEICIFRQPRPTIGIPTSGIVYDVDYPDRGRSAIDHVFSSWLTQSVRVFAASSNTRRELIELAPSAAQRVDVLPLPSASFVDAPASDVMRWRRSVPVLFYPAVATPRKGHNVLSCALATLVDDNVPFHCYLSGDGIEEMTSTWPSGVRAHVTALGRVAWPDVRALYAATDVVVLPSLREGYGLPFSEALRCERPLIASRLPSFEEQATFFGAHDHVKWVQPGDVEALTAALRDFLIGRRTFPQFQSNLKNRLRDWTWDHYARTIVDSLRAS